ncbi:MAG: helix-turn-helix transcriptional regulator [Lachnospiraceae bacterium]|nr:helix-turn-helix transcriptional regulator [Lachnospiraceae bacterium]
MSDMYGEQIRSYRVRLGLTQKQVADEMEVTPGYISNVENGRTGMSLRMLIYYARLMGMTLDELVGDLEPSYQAVALDHALMSEIGKLKESDRKKLLEMLRIWNA